jgi:phytoene synthase
MVTLQTTYEWEQPLLSLALPKRPFSHDPHPTTHISYNESQEALDWAYQYCEQLTEWHSKSFYMASRLLSPDKRKAVRALYAFCRTTDDIVDNPSGNVETQLSLWRSRALAHRPQPHDLVPMAWSDAVHRYHIPHLYAQQLIDGVARDLHQTRYQTFAELAEYSYGVASTVGLMSAHIIGFTNQDAIPYAIRLGVALQMTNILRDVAEDWQRGRVYLPQDELAAFGLSEADIAAGQVTDKWRAFMRFQIDRNRRLYAEAWPGIAMLSADGRMSIAAAAELYAAILNDIEKHDYDVFTRRAHINKWGKLSRMPALWWRTRQPATA